MTKLTTLDEYLDALPQERKERIYQMAEELRLDAGLAQIRENLELSQKALAEALGISQPAVAQIEQRGNDLRLVTLKRYIEAMGGKLSLTVQMPTGDSRIFQI